MSTRSTALALWAIAAAAPIVRGQSMPAPPPLLQLEVGDSIGLPLPDAKVESFALMQGAAFLEWVPIDPANLSPGVYLLRFSYPGYRTATFSVPIRKGSRVSLRVRLGAEHDTTRGTRTTEAAPIRAIGLLLEGRATTDIVRSRRVLERAAIERANTSSVGELLRGTKETGLVVKPGAGRDYRITAPASGGPYGCTVPVMINGDPRWLFPFDEMNRRYSADEVEAAEFLPRSVARVYARHPEEGDCGLLLLWVRPR